LTINMFLCIGFGKLKIAPIELSQIIGCNIIVIKCVVSKPCRNSSKVSFILHPEMTVHCSVRDLWATNCLQMTGLLNNNHVLWQFVFYGDNLCVSTPNQKIQSNLQYCIEFEHKYNCVLYKRAKYWKSHAFVICPRCFCELAAQ
jgi:hypothetical protein